MPSEMTIDDSDKLGVENADFPFGAEFHAAAQAAGVAHGRRTSAADFDVFTRRNLSAAGGFGENFFGDRFSHARGPMCPERIPTRRF